MVPSRCSIAAILFLPFLFRSCLPVSWPELNCNRRTREEADKQEHVHRHENSVPFFHGFWFWFWFWFFFEIHRIRWPNVTALLGAECGAPLAEEHRVSASSWSFRSSCTWVCTWPKTKTLAGHRKKGKRSTSIDSVTATPFAIQPVIPSRWNTHTNYW